MRLMLGFTYPEADAYARKYGWRREMGHYVDGNGESVIHVVGDHDVDANRFRRNRGCD